VWTAIFFVLAFAAYLSFVFAIVTKLRAGSDRRD
jgi:hypothetical protein